MSSSDEDDDCYGNVAKKLQTLKNSYRPIQLAKLSPDKTGDNVSKVSCSVDVDSQSDSIIDLLEEVPSVPESPAKTTQQPKHKNTPKKRVTRQSRKSCNDTPLSTPIDNAPSSSRRGRKRKNNTSKAAGMVEESLPPPSVDTNVTASSTSSRGRGRSRGGRSARGGRRRHLDDLRAAIMESIIYSIGNTDEYPDTAENIPIFSKETVDNTPKTTETIELDCSIDDENEELSVKICWQQIDYFKFTVRRYQKLTQIFDFFSKRESVPIDRLFFTLAGRILRPDDTPDSIQYNIAKFIDGGVLNSSMGNITTSNAAVNVGTTGIIIKFQCQNSKRPFQTNVEANQKLHIAMVKCAEHFELPFSKLRFILDGETVSPSSTPDEHGLEDGDCFDVNIVT